MRCWLREVGLATKPCAYRADGLPDRAHIGFKKNWLVKAPTGPRLSEEEAMDPRIWVPMCRACHQASEFGSIRIPRYLFPDSVEEFARDHKLLWKLNKDYGPV